MRTEQILQNMERAERRRKRRKLIWRIKREILCFAAQFAGTAIFTFIAVPLMEYNTGRTVLICEVALVIGFSLWLGNKIYCRNGREN